MGDIFGIIILGRYFRENFLGEFFGGFYGRIFGRNSFGGIDLFVKISVFVKILSQGRRKEEEENFNP